MVTYVKRSAQAGYAGTGGSTIHVGIYILNTYTTGTATAVTAPSTAPASNTTSVRFITNQQRPNTTSWTGGDYTYHYRCTTANSNLTFNGVTLNRLSNDCQTVKASKFFSVNHPLGTTGDKTGTLTWNDGTQNPANASADDRFEIIFDIFNSNSMTAQSIIFGANGSATGSDDTVVTPWSETAESAGRGFAVIDFTKPTTTGAQDQTITPSGITFKPKAAIFMWTQQTSAFGTFDETYNLGMGFADGNGNNRAMSGIGVDNVSTTDTGSVYRKNCIGIATAAGTGATLGSAASVKEFKANGEFILNWSTNANTNATRIVAILIGGGDITDVLVGSHGITTGTGNKALTTVGFQPTINFFIPSNQNVHDLGDTDGVFGFGAAISSTKRFTQSLMLDDGATTGNNAWRYQRTDRCVSCFSNTGAIRYEGDFVSNDAEGYTINVSTAPATTLQTYFLCIKGAEWDLGNDTMPTSGGLPVSKSVSVTSGKTPIGVILSSYGETAQTTVQTNARMSFGAAASTSSRYAVWSGYRNAQYPTHTARKMYNNKVLVANTKVATATSSTIEAEADLSSFASGSFNLSFSTIPASAYQFLWIAMLTTASGTLFTRTLTETLDFGQQFQKQRTVSKTFSETLNMQQQFKRPYLSRSYTQTLNLAENFNKLRSISKTFTETLNMAQTFARPFLSRFYTQTLNMQQQFQKLRTVIRTLTETLNFAEQFQKLRSVARTLTETLNLNQNFARSSFIFRSFNETLNFGQQFARIQYAVRTFTQSLNFEQIFQKQRSVSRTFTETLNFGQTFQKLRSISKTFTQTLDFSQDFDAHKLFIRTVEETLNFAQTFTRPFIARSFSETLNLGQQFQKLRSISKTFTETLNLEQQFAKLRTVSRSFNESLDFAQTFTRPFISRSFTQTLNFEQNFSRIGYYFRSFIQSLNFEQSFSFEKYVGLILRSFTQTLDFGQQFTRQAVKNRTFTEALDFAQQFAKQRSISKTFTETLNFGQMFQKLRSIQRSLAETLNFSQSFTRPFISRSFAQTLDFDQTFDRVAVKARSFAETLNFGQVFSRQKLAQLFTRTFTETLNFNQNFSRTKLAVRTFVQSLDFGQQFNKSSFFQRAFTQTLNFSQNFAGQLSRFFSRTFTQSLDFSSNVDRLATKVRNFVENLDFGQSIGIDTTGTFSPTRPTKGPMPDTGVSKILSESIYFPKSNQFANIQDTIDFLQKNRSPLLDKLLQKIKILQEQQRLQNFESELRSLLTSQQKQQQPLEANTETKRQKLKKLKVLAEITRLLKLLSSIS